MATINSIEDEAELQKMVNHWTHSFFFNKCFFLFIQFNAAKDPDERKMIRTRLLEVKKINSGMKIFFPIKILLINKS
jgi:hypothetical protein